MNDSKTSAGGNLKVRYHSGIQNVWVSNRGSMRSMKMNIIRPRHPQKYMQLKAVLYYHTRESISTLQTQSTLPLPPPPRKLSFSSNLKKPPLFLLILRLKSTSPKSKVTIMTTILTILWLLIAPRMSKISSWMLPIVDFGLRTGGEEMTFGMVSRIEVRDAIMLLPVMVWSQ